MTDEETEAHVSEISTVIVAFFNERGFNPLQALCVVESIRYAYRRKVAREIPEFDWDAFDSMVATLELRNTREESDAG